MRLKYTKCLCHTLLHTFGCAVRFNPIWPTNCSKIERDDRLVVLRYGRHQPQMGKHKKHPRHHPA
jgi:hypothetical protein